MGLTLEAYYKKLIQKLTSRAESLGLFFFYQQVASGYWPPLPYVLPSLIRFVIVFLYWSLSTSDLTLISLLEGLFSFFILVSYFGKLSYIPRCILHLLVFEYWSHSLRKLKPSTVKCLISFSYIGNLKCFITVFKLLLVQINLISILKASKQDIPQLFLVWNASINFRWEHWR